MDLKQDQRALLQLILERGQSYEDLAGLLGIEPPAVRARAREALETLGGKDPDADVGLTDYLLGQADHIGRADVARFLQQDPATHDLAGDLATKLQALAPTATLPRLPAAKASRRSGATTTRSADPAGGRSPRTSGLTPDQRRLWLFGVLGVILTIAILAIAGVFSGDDDEALPTAEQEPALPAGDDPTAPIDAGEDAPLTETELRPVSGSGVGGRAEFGLSDQVLFLDVQVDGLAPAEDDQIYLVWLMASEDAGFPLPTPLAPDENGSVGGQIAVPAPATQLVAPITTSVLISSTDRQELNQNIKEARDAESPLLPFVGERLAAGELPAGEAGVAPGVAPGAEAPGAEAPGAGE